MKTCNACEHKTILSNDHKICALSREEELVELRPTKGFRAKQKTGWMKFVKVSDEDMCHMGLE